MSKRIMRCPWCNHSNVTAEGRNHYCNYCGYEWQSEKTVFDQITQSPEVLAEKLVYMSYIKKKLPLTDMRGWLIGYKSVLRQVWKSSVTEETYSKKAEAIAATVARLNEVEK